MISIILASGCLSGSMSSLVSTDSILRLPMGNKTALSEILQVETWASEVVFVVHAGPAPDFYTFLKSKAKWIDIEFSGLTIGHSVMAALDQISDYLARHQNSKESVKVPARIIFADTVTSLHGLDAVAIGDAETSEDWTFAPANFSDEVIQGRATVVSQRVIAGAFSFSNLALFHDILSNNLRSHDPLLCADPFFEAIREYSGAVEGGLVGFHDPDWQDIGHREGYFKHRQARLQGREFNSFVFGPGGLFISKKSRNSEKLINEANWFRKVPAGLSKFLPRVILGGEDHYEIQYVKALTLAEKVLYGEPRRQDLSFATDRLQAWFSATSEQSVSTISKIEQKQISAEFARWFKGSMLSRFDFIDKNAMLLGAKSQEVLRVTAEARERVKMLCFPDSSPSIVHGDLIFSNILVDEKDGVFKLIDPRGGFGKASCFGLQIYDWAKLAQSIFGRYEEFIAGEYEILGLDDSLRLSNDPARLANYKLLADWFSSSCPSPEFAKQLGGLLLLAAIPFHIEDKRRMHAMFLMGSGLANL